jgi:hypothetical protein
MAPSLTLFFIVEPPNYDSYACYLAASIREHLPGHIKLVGYCPAAKRDEVHPAVVETLTRMDCELRTFETVNRFDPAYPHGNKILACLEERETDFAGFVDSDVIFIKDQDLSEYLHHDKVSCSPAVSMKWTDQSIWDQVYGALDMSLPVERMALMRQKKQVHLPYYSSGIVYFSEIYRTGDGQRFPQVWMDTAQRIDAAPDIRRKRPYLDQLSLAPAIRRAGLGWCPLAGRTELRARRADARQTPARRPRHRRCALPLLGVPRGSRCQAQGLRDAAEPCRCAPHSQGSRQRRSEQGRGKLRRLSRGTGRTKGKAFASSREIPQTLQRNNKRGQSRPQIEQQGTLRVEMNRRPVASLWIGERLHYLNQMCLASHVRHGHPVTLYCTHDVPNVPEGVEVRPASDIWDIDMTLVDGTSPAFVANVWRCRMIRQTGAIWVDCDAFCHAPFPDEWDYIFGEHGFRGALNNGVLGMPSDSALLDALLDYYENLPDYPPWWNPRQKQEDGSPGRETAAGRTHLQDRAHRVRPPGADAFREGNRGVRPAQTP